MNVKPISRKKIELVKQHYEIEGRLTVRRCYYIWLTHKLITIEGKTKKQKDSLYKKQSEYLTRWREKGYIPPEMIIDETRRVIEGETFDSFKEAFDHHYKTFSMNSMKVQDRYVEAWIEKDTMKNTYADMCVNHDVPLVISRGFASYSCKYEAKKRFEKIGKPITVLVCGDFDAEGLYIQEATENFLGENSPDLDIRFRRVLLNEDDFEELREFHVDFTPSERSLRTSYVNQYVGNYGRVKLEVEAIDLPPVNAPPS